MNPAQLFVSVSVASVTGSVVKSGDFISSNYMGSSSWEAAKSLLSKFQVPSIPKQRRKPALIFSEIKKTTTGSRD